MAHVEGWLHLDEAWALHEAVRNFRPDQHAMAVVEIGSWKGRSTIALASGACARPIGKAAKVYAIDPHTGTKDGPEVGPVSTITEFRSNVAAAGLDSVVELVQATSHEARARFGARSVDILFMDGSHQYEDVKTDISDWQPTLRDTALVAFNDPSIPGVYRALREMVIKPWSPYRRPRLIHNTLFFDFRRTIQWTRHDEITLFRLRSMLQLRYHANRVGSHVPTWLARLGRPAFRAMVSRILGRGSPPKSEVQ